jgi:WD40 repeat protein
MRLGLAAAGVTRTYALSPKGTYLALDTGDGGVDIAATHDASVRRLAGEAVTVVGIRWSDDEKRLAYFSSGMPAVANGDGSNALVSDASLPPAAAGYSFQDAEWSPDGSTVAFVTRGTALLTDARGADVRSFSEKAVVHYASPWAVAFSPDGALVALLQADAADDRTVLVTRTDTLESREISGIRHSAFLGWSTDGQFLTLADTNYGLWLVPRVDGKPVEVGGYGHPSPVAPELGFVRDADQSLHVQALDGTGDRVVSRPAQGIARWAPDGSALAYNSSPLTERVVSASDGKVLVPTSTWISFGPDGRLARGEGSTTLITQDLRRGPDSAATFTVEQLPPAGDQFEWLPGGKIAYVRNRFLYVADPDGAARVSCGDVRGIAMPQAPRVFE